VGFSVPNVTAAVIWIKRNQPISEERQLWFKKLWRNIKLETWAENWGAVPQSLGGPCYT